MSTIIIPYEADISFHFPDGVAVNDEFKRVMPYDGEVLNYGGSLAVLGTGGGTSVDVQVENDDTGDLIFTVQPTFEVDSASKVVEGGQLASSPTFRAGQTLRAYITAVSTTPEDGVFTLHCKLYKRVTV